MKLLLIGSSVKDYIHIHRDAEEIIKPGGLYYSALGLHSIMNEEDTAYLLTTLSPDTADLFAPLYSCFSGEYIYMSDKIPVVHLNIWSEHERCEKYENITDRLNTGLIAEPETFDGILINMITGFDITSDDLASLRIRNRGLIYFDLHTLSRGINEKGGRIFRPVPDIEKWLRSIDILQLNENELLTLADKGNEYSREEAVLKALSLGVKYVALTSGEKGAEIFWLEHGSLARHFESAAGGKLEMPVGCGDKFGAAFFYTFLKNGGDAKDSLRAAVRAAVNV